MEVTLALLADAANVSREGNLNLLGVFDSIVSRSFPATHPQMQLVLRFEAGAAEFGRTRAFAALLVDADGQRSALMEGSMVVPHAPAGERASWQEIVTLRGMTFPHAGRYVLAIMIDGDTRAEIPLRLLHLDQRDGEAAAGQF